MPDELKKDAGDCQLEEGERLGFCFPVHGWQPPRIVRRFIRQSTFRLLPSTYVYALVTCGDSIGRTMEMLFVALVLDVLALLMYILWTHRWFLRHKNR
jgi:hypothetical protein